MTSFPQAKTAHLAWVRPFALASLSLLPLSAWLFERVAATGGLAFVLLQGIRFDLVAPGLLLAIPMALTPLVSAIGPLHTLGSCSCIRTWPW